MIRPSTQIFAHGVPCEAVPDDEGGDDEDAAGPALGARSAASSLASGIHTSATPNAIAEVVAPATYGARSESIASREPMAGQTRYVALPRPRKLAINLGRSLCG